MTTTASYILRVNAEGNVYFFQYEDCGDVYQALEKFWHDDYDDYLSGYLTTKAWPIDVYVMDGGKMIGTYELQFCTSAFHAFFDKGHTANGVYTLDQFWSDIQRNRTPCITLFGHLAVSFYENGDYEGLQEALHNGDAGVSIRDFDSEAERTAYINGLYDGDGWCDYTVVSPADTAKVQAVCD